MVFDQQALALFHLAGNGRLRRRRKRPGAWRTHSSFSGARRFGGTHPARSEERRKRLDQWARAWKTLSFARPEIRKVDRVSEDPWLRGRSRATAVERQR